MAIIYEFSYRDVEDDVLECTNMVTLEEAQKEAKEVREEGGKILETWKYVDGEFVGRPNL